MVSRTDIIDDLKQAAVGRLAQLVSAALQDAAAELAGEGAFLGAGSDPQQRQQAVARTVQRFEDYLCFCFDRLVRPVSRRVEVGDFPYLTLVESGFVEAVNAMEGMVSFARNASISPLISLGTRLETLLDGRPMDETTNPLDPERISQAFVDALGPLQVAGPHTLTLYRHFNRHVLRELHGILEQANRICIGYHLLPDLVVDALDREQALKRRSGRRPSNSPLERAFATDDEVLAAETRQSSAGLHAMILDLLRGEGAGHGSTLEGRLDGLPMAVELVVPADGVTRRNFPGSPVTELGMLPIMVKPGGAIGERVVEPVSRDQLLGLLDQVQAELVRVHGLGPRVVVCHRHTINLLGQALLRSSRADSLNAIPSGAFDSILLVAMLFEAFAEDRSLVEPIKELVVATQVTLMKMALLDPDILGHEAHPVRLLLNEVATGGIGWTDLDRLRNDATYNKLQALVFRLVTEYDGTPMLVDELLAELHRFRAPPDSAARLRTAGEAADSEQSRRLEDIRRYVGEKIRERVGQPLPAAVEEIVQRHYHRFLVGIAQRDGAGSNSWFLVMKMLDLLLWSVRPGKSEIERQRLEDINGMLLVSVGKALGIAGVERSRIPVLLDRLRDAQQASFDSTGDVPPQDPGAGPADPPAPQHPCHERQADGDAARRGISPAAEADDYLAQARRLPVGAWVKFNADGRQVYCTLGAKLESANRLVFVNRAGVRVVEKTLPGLARELRDGSVTIIGDRLLFERGMESIIASLRNR